MRIYFILKINNAKEYYKVLHTIFYKKIKNKVDILTNKKIDPLYLLILFKFMKSNSIKI